MKCINYNKIKRVSLKSQAAIGDFINLNYELLVLKLFTDYKRAERESKEAFRIARIKEEDYESLSRKWNQIIQYFDIEYDTYEKTEINNESSFIVKNRTDARNN